MANYTVHDHIKLGRVTALAAAPGGDWLAVAVQRLDRDGAKYVSDLWKVPTDGSAPTQLTRGDTSETSPCFRNDGSLGFLSNRQPNELKPDEAADKRAQVWIFPAGGGEPQQVTDEPLGVEAFRFARNADRMVVLAPVIPQVPHDKQRETAGELGKNGPSARRFTRQPVRHWDHWLHENANMANNHAIAYTADGRNRSDLTPEATRELAIEPHLDLSDDGGFLALTWQTAGADRVLDTTILVTDVETGVQSQRGVKPNANCDPPLFSPDGKTLATVRSVRSVQKVMRPLLLLIDVQTGAERALAEHWDRWPQLAAWSADGKNLFVTADDQGDTAIFVVRVESGAVTRLAGAGAWSNIEILADGRVAGIRSTLLDPPECYVIQQAPNSRPTALARLSGFDGADWADVEDHTTPSTDGVPIHYFVVKPKHAAGRLPLLLWIHGGPIGMDADAWHWRWNPLLAVAQGYAVALPNPRGSTGFGQDFIQGIWGNVWGDQCFKDLMCVADALETRPDIDPARTMAMGGSFGGYMTNWIGTQTQRFRCLITHASIFTMAHFTGVTDHPAWWHLEMGGEDPFVDQPRFDRFAPVRYVKNWKTPTLIIHGEIDYRCPLGEGLNLFEALQYHGTPSELLLFPDEGHWILKPKNIVVWYDTVLEFIKRYLS